MAEWNYLWWDLPKKPEEIQVYTDNKFAYAGDHVWMKLLKASFEKRLQESFNKSAAPEPVVNKASPKKGA